MRHKCNTTLTLSPYVMKKKPISFLDINQRLLLSLFLQVKDRKPNSVLLREDLLHGRHNSTNSSKQVAHAKRPTPHAHGVDEEVN